MIKHGASHGCATLTTTVFAGIIVFLLNKLTPRVLDSLNPVANKISSYLQVWFVSEDVLGILLLASLMAVLWGVAFRFKTT